MKFIEKLKSSLYLLLNVSFVLTYLGFTFGIIYPLILLQTKLIGFIIKEDVAFIFLFIEFYFIYVYAENRIIKISTLIGIITVYTLKLWSSYYYENDVFINLCMTISSTLLLKMCKDKISKKSPLYL